MLGLVGLKGLMVGMFLCELRLILVVMCEVVVVGRVVVLIFSGIGLLFVVLVG